MSVRTISIIGGGASAVLLLAHYARLQTSHRDHIRIYEKNLLCGRGLAYGTAHMEHLLNVRANRMSGLAHAPDDFAQFVQHRGIAADDFAPRRIYGDYLLSLLADARARLETRGAVLDILHENVDEDAFARVAETSDIVVIATGNAHAVRPTGADELSAADGWHDNPWAMEYRVIGDDQDIIILGTGLSMVDALQSLAARDFRGKITALARNGLMPRPHAPPLAPYPVFLTAGDERLRARPSAYALVRRVRAEIKAAVAQGIMWQAVIDSLRHDTNDLWGLLPEGERAKFLRRLMPFWAVHRHRMPPRAHQVAQDMLASGQLTIHKNPVTMVARGSAGELRVQTRGQIYHAPHVINCLGYRYPVWVKAADLPHCYKIGPPCFGAMLETTAIPEIRAQADRLAQIIAR